MGWERTAEESLDSTQRDSVDRVPRLAGASARGRILGVEVARALAIIGMLSVHIRPASGDSIASFVYTLPHGRASLLFMLVAGIAVSLLAASPRLSTWDVRMRLIWRAVVLLPLGLWLQELDISVLVILQTYAVLFLLAVVMLELSDRALLALAGLSAVVGPLIILALEVSNVRWHAGDATSLSDSIGFIARALLWSGSYPLVTWIAPFLLGMWLGRRDLRQPSVHIALVVYGAAFALGAGVLSRTLSAFISVSEIIPSWGRVIVDAPHSQMPLWLWGSTGAAVMVLGLSLIAAEAARRLVWPLVALGQLALTAYVAHLLALHFWPATLSTESIPEAFALLAALTALGVVFAVAWRAMFMRGPLEAVLNAPWAAVARFKHSALR